MGNEIGLIIIKAWGWGSKTEVGHGAADRQNTPLLILEGKNIAKVKLPGEIELPLTEIGHPYSFQI